MKIATLQFDSKIGDVAANIKRADELLVAADLRDVELIVAPELALTGYNFSSLEDISKYLEPTCAGPTAWWAAGVAQKYGCVVSVGYTEITISPQTIPSQVLVTSHEYLSAAIESSRQQAEQIKESPTEDFWTFNSTITVGPDGKVLAHYRKTHLYFSDAVWASPSIEGFTTATIQFSKGSPVDTAFAICMDLNPKAFTAPWSEFEVASHTVAKKASLLVVSTAWSSRSLPSTAGPDEICCSQESADEPDMETLTYWIERLLPMIQSSEISAVAISNRIGIEEDKVGTLDLDKLIRPAWKRAEVISSAPNAVQLDGTQAMQTQSTATINENLTLQEAGPTEAPKANSPAHFAGTSTVLSLGRGHVSVHGVLGKGIEGVLVADTREAPVMAFSIEMKDS